MTSDVGLTFEPTCERGDWNAYCAQQPAATVYHAYEWMEILGGAFRHRFFPLVARSGGRVVGVFPLVLVRTRLFGTFLVSLPIVNYGGIIADGEEAERGLWSAAIELARREGARYLEARRLSPSSLATPRKQHKATMILTLAPSVEEQWKGFDAKLRNQTRKAEKSGLRARIASGDGLEPFYEVFASCMRDLGTPVWTARLFDQALRALPSAARLVLVEDGGTAVAAGIAFAYRDTLVVPWTASLREHWSKSPNNLLYWELIQLAIRERLARFDFGRSTPGDGVYRFKEQWGAKPVPLYWEYWLPSGGPLPDLSPGNRKFHAAIEVWRRLPVSVTRWLGPPIARGIP